MGDERRRPVQRSTEADDEARRRAGVRKKIIGRLLLEGGTVERPAPRSSLVLDLPPMRWLARGRRRGGS